MKRREAKRGIRLTGAEHEEILCRLGAGVRESGRGHWMFNKVDTETARSRSLRMEAARRIVRGLRSKAPHVEIFVPGPAGSQPIHGSEKSRKGDSNNAGRRSR